jgi:ribokinase
LVVAQYGQEPVDISAQKVTVKSTHGAGDCFVAQLAVALAQGNSLQNAAAMANATAAAYVAGELSPGGG